MMILKRNIIIALVLLALFLIPESDAKPKNRNRGRNKNKRILKKGEKALLKSYMRRVAKLNGATSAEVAADEAADSEKAYAPSTDEDDTEYSRNIDSLDELFESDIVLTKRQLKELNKELDEGGNRRFKRKLTQYTSRRWPTTVPYIISGLDSRAKSAIAAGIQNWEQETCLKFVQRSSQRNYLKFIRGSGCYSNVGSIGGSQDVSIGYGCETKGIAAHEIGHALGFWHEQSRTDRDQYVKINTQNIRPANLGNFNLHRTTTNLGIPYDFGSVMHYGPTAFITARGLRSIDSKDPKFGSTFGQRNRLSFIDVKMMNIAYCSNVCRRNLSCKNGGYTDPKNCNKCRCPEGLSGDCTQADTSGGCGGNIVASSSWKTISAPTLRANQKCAWHVKSSNGGRIQIEVSRVNYPCSTTCRSFVELKTNSDFQQTGARFCCNRPSTLTSQKSDAVILHETDASTSSRYSGFQLRVRSLGGGPVTTRRTTIRTTIRTTTPRTTRRTTRWTPATTTKRPTGNGWGAWGAWSQCSKTCGGCGTSKRTRKCNGGRCSGSKQQTRPCNQLPCKSNTKTCKTTGWVLCSLGTSDSVAVSDVADDVKLPSSVPKDAEVKIQKAQKSRRRGVMCRRTITYPCNRGSSKNLTNDGCCKKYKLSPSNRNICIKA